jgi:hypothetical protein
LAASAAFTANLDTIAEALGYAGATAATAARTYLGTVTITAATPAEVTNAVAAAVAVGTTTTGPTLALTSGVDTIVGTAGNNTIDATRVVLSGQLLDSLNNADSVDGGAGTDTLVVQLIGGGTTTTPASLKNVEIVTVEATAGGGATLSLLNGDASITTVKSANSAGNVAVTNIQSAPTAFEVSTTAANFTASVATTKLVGTTDAATLLLTNVTGAAVITIGNVAATGGNGYETIAITSAGTVANSIILDDTPGGNVVGTLATITVAGATNLTLASVANMTTVTKVDASTLTGTLTYTAAATNGQAMTVTGGLGNDIIDVQGYTTADTINGGAGIDRLVLTSAEAAATAVQTNVSNIEVIGIAGAAANGATYTISNFGATGLRLDGTATAGALNVNYAAGTNSLDLQNSTGGGALVANVAGVLTTDVLNLTMGSAAAGNAFAAAITTNGVETINLVTQGGAVSGTAFTMTNTAATESLIITGNQSISFTGIVTADVINASGLTGSATLTLTGGTGVNAATITGTANADTLIGGTAGDIINGGAGADTIVNVLTGAVTAGDILTGGAGFDTFVLRGVVASGAVSTVLPTAAFVTDFTVGSTAATTDILSLSATIASYDAAGGGIAFFGGIAAAVAGATSIQTVAQNAAAAAVVTGTDFIKLSTGVTTTGLTVQQAFNNAIGTGTVTGLTASDRAFVSFYDTTNARMEILVVNANANVNTVLESADVVTLVGSVAMSAADYASFSAANLAIIA